MNMESFEQGKDSLMQESLMQAIAIMRDEEEYRRKFGGVPDILSNRRETSITALCDMISRMKREIDVKNKCVKLLEDIVGGWKDVQDERQRMSKRIKELEKINGELQKKLDISEAKKTNTEQSRSKVSDKDNTSDDNLNSNSIEEVNECEIVADSRRRGDNEDGNEVPCQPRYDISSVSEGSSSDLDWLNKSPNSSSVGWSHPPLTNNPYDSLDTSYYNPTQFFQRLSTTNARKPNKRGGNSSGGRGKGKKADTSSTQSDQAKVTAPKKRNAKPKKTISTDFDIDQVIEEVIHDSIDNSATSSIYGNIPNTSNQPETSNQIITRSVSAEEKSSSDESLTKKGYFDYTSTFLDETETTDENYMSP